MQYRQVTCVPAAAEWVYTLRCINTKPSIIKVFYIQTERIDWISMFAFKIKDMSKKGNWVTLQEAVGPLTGKILP